MLHDENGNSGTKMPLALLVESLTITCEPITCSGWSCARLGDAWLRVIALDPSTPLGLVHHCRESSCYKYVLLLYADKAHQLMLIDRVPVF